MREKENIIKFPNSKNKKSQLLSDTDINNLFLGLVKLVKNNLEKQLSEKQNFIEKDYRKALILIADKDDEIERLNLENEKLSESIRNLKDKMQEIRAINLKNLEEA